MKFVATKSILKDFSEIKNFVSYIGEGLILLPETSFDPQIVGTNLEELIEYTSDYPVTIVGEKDRLSANKRRGIYFPIAKSRKN